MSELKSKDGEFIGAGMTWKFIKDKIDTAHIRGYAVLVVRATSPDEPDDRAVYNLYQVDANKGRASGDLYEALKDTHSFLPNSPDFKSPTPYEVAQIALDKAEGK